MMEPTPRPSLTPSARRAFLRFALAGLIGTLAVALGSGFASRRAGEAEAMDDVRRLTAVIATTVVEPNLDATLLAGDPAAIERLDRIVKQRVLQGPSVRVKLWGADGTILYSDEPRLIGDRYELEDDKRESLWSGTVVSEVSNLDGPENRFEKDFGRLLEVYLPVAGPAGEPVLYESYFEFEEVSRSTRRIWLAFFPIVLGALAAMELGQLLLAWSMAGRLSRSQRDREGLLRKALDASDRERRRIASDLHDGVVQDLAGVSFAIATVAEAVGADAPAAVTSSLRTASRGARSSIQALRTLMVDIHPPNLIEQGLEGAVSDLLSPLSLAGITTELEIPEGLHLSPDREALTFRFVQEAIRNTVRHADANTVTVAIAHSESTTTVRVIDDGRGFDPADVPAPQSHMGLKLLSELAADHDATLSIESSEGSGTMVILEFGSP